VKGDLPDLEPSVKQNLLRITQEAGTNAIKHASATRLELRIHADAKSIVFSVVDDGTGLQKTSLQADWQHGFGIRGMQERANRIGGILQIEKNSPKGTVVRVTVPTP
jgi:signal transduction histidine kinase